MIEQATAGVRQWLSRMRRMSVSSFLADQALERTLDQLADRLARTEVALLREQQRHDQTRRRMAAAEAEMLRLRDLRAPSPSGPAAVLT